MCVRGKLYYEHFKWVPAIANIMKIGKSFSHFHYDAMFLFRVYNVLALIKVCQTIEDEVTLAMDQMIVQTNEE